MRAGQRPVNCDVPSFLKKYGRPLAVVRGRPGDLMAGQCYSLHRRPHIWEPRPLRRVHLVHQDESGLVEHLKIAWLPVIEKVKTVRVLLFEVVHQVLREEDVPLCTTMDPCTGHRERGDEGPVQSNPSSSWISRRAVNSTVGHLTMAARSTSDFSMPPPAVLQRAPVLARIMTNAGVTLSTTKARAFCNWTELEWGTTKVGIAGQKLRKP